MYNLGNKSKSELMGVHPHLIKVVEEAIKITTVDFGAQDGLRTMEEQREYVRRGVSKTFNSRHLPQKDGYSHAVDLVPYINGRLRWEWEPIYHIAHAVDYAATQLNVPLVWGGVWDRTMMQYGGSADAIEEAVQGYVRRRRKKGRKAFIDGPHYQLSSQYRR